MPISFSCENCGKSFVVSDGLAGKRATCKGCGNKIQVPGGSDSGSAALRSVAPRAASQRTAAPSPLAAEWGSPAAAPAPRPRPAATASAPSAVDIYGLDEAPSALPPRGVGMPSRSVDEDSAPVRPIPAKKKKKKSQPFFGGGTHRESGGGFWSGVVLIRIGIAVFAGLAGVMGWGFASKSEIDAFFTKQISQLNQVTTILKTVRDASTAQRASAQCIAILNEMADHLEKEGSRKGRQDQIDAANAKFLPTLRQGWTEFGRQRLRIASIPGALQALNLDASLARYEAIGERLSKQNR